MPQVVTSVEVPVPPAVTCAVSQTHGEVRRRWDVFIRAQRFPDGAEQPARGCEDPVVLAAAAADRRARGEEARPGRAPLPRRDPGTLVPPASSIRPETGTGTTPLPGDPP